MSSVSGSRLGSAIMAQNSGAEFRIQNSEYRMARAVRRLGGRRVGEGVRVISGWTGDELRSPVLQGRKNRADFTDDLTEFFGFGQAFAPGQAHFREVVLFLNFCAGDDLAARV